MNYALSWYVVRIVYNTTKLAINRVHLLQNLIFRCIKVLLGESAMSQFVANVNNVGNFSTAKLLDLEVMVGYFLRRSPFLEKNHVLAE